MHEEIADHEKWLAVYSTPAPSASAVARAKSAAREAMLSSRVRRPKTAWRVWQGVAASAAIIALAVFVGYRAVQTAPSAPMAVAERDPIPSLPEASREGTTRVTDFDDDLTDLETWSAQANWGMSGASLFELMDEALDDDTDRAPGENGSS
jgi:hypothetical protein